MKLPTDPKSIWDKKPPPPPPNPKNYPNLFPEYVYAMVNRVEEDENNFKFIYLINPHKNDSTGYNFNIDSTTKNVKVAPDGKKDITRIVTRYDGSGELKIELNDFIKYFGCYEIGGTKKNI